MAGAPIEVHPDSLPEAFQQRRQVALDEVPLEARLSPSSGIKLCTHQRWLARPAGSHCPNYWDSLMDTAKLQRVFRFCMGSHMLPIEQGRHLQLPRHRRVCKLCRTGALGDGEAPASGVPCPS